MADFDKNEIDQVVDDLRFAGKAEGDIVCAAAADLIDQLRQRLAEVAAANTANKAGFEEYERRYYLEVNAREDAEAKLALAEQDARRYRYVRSENAKGMHGAFAIHEAGDNDWFYTSHHDLDQLIDAAIDASGHDSIPPHK